MNHRPKARSRQAGFGIMQVVFVMAALFAASIFATQYLTRQAKLSKLRRQNSKYSAMVDHLRQQLNDPLICSPALKALNLNISALGSAWSPIPININYGAQAGPLKAGWKDPVNDLELKRVEMRADRRAMQHGPVGLIPRNVIYDLPNSPPTANQFFKFYGWIRILPADSHWNTEDQEDWIPIVFITTTTGVIHGCFGPMSIAEACEANGGAYDFTTQSPPELRCNPQFNCYNHSMGLVSSPGVCTAPYVANPMGYMNCSAKYLCTWCNRNM